MTAARRLAVILSTTAACLAAASLSRPVRAQSPGKTWVEKSTVSAPVAGQKRLALILGNTHYGGKHELKNPENDAKAIALALGRVGFTSIVVLDGSRDQMRDAVHEFADRIRVAGDSSVALIYYSGHGMQVGGENYLVPIGFHMPAVTDVAAAVVDSPTSGRFTPPLTLARYKAQMVRVPAGAFTMGSDTSVRVAAKPAHRVTLSAYRIGRTDVTVGMWEEFCAATKRKMPREPEFNAGWSKKDHPVVNVSWKDAQAYCVWAHLKLPTEAQWEKAARGTDCREFPWGKDFDPKKLWCSTAKYGEAGGTRMVGAYPGGASPYGCLDMAGNVFQWCVDRYDGSFYESRNATEADPVNESAGSERVLRGGSWYSCDADDSRCALRYGFGPSFRDVIIGFRAVLSGH